MFCLAACYSLTEQNEEAIALYRRILRKEPNQLTSQLGLVITLMKTGKEDEARAEAAKVLRIDPQFSLERYAKTLDHFKDRSVPERMIKAWRKAGLK